MPSVPAESPWSRQAMPDLLNLASSVLTREASRVQAAPLGMPVPAPSLPGAAPSPRRSTTNSPSLTGRTCPVTGATAQPAAADPARLRQQAQDLVAALFPDQVAAAAGPRGASRQDPSAGWPAAASLGTAIHRLGALVAPFIGASVPIPPPDMDLLRRQSHEFIESLLVTFSQATGEKAAPYEDQIPLIRCAAPVRAGDDGTATMGVANDDDAPSDVSLYCTNFVADSGNEIPSLRVTVSPRRATIPPKGDATFSIRLAVPQQTPAGTYSGLIQAMGSKYVKAVLSVEVL
jgi:hypothetical protein